MPASYALGRQFEDIIAELIESGRFNSKSEVVREALRLLQAREELRAMQIEELRRAFRQGIESGPGIAADEVHRRLVAKYESMAEERDA